MPASSFTSRLYLHSSLLWNVFLPWYLLERPATIAKSYIAYARSTADIFSIVFLLKTLLSPWKSIADEYPDNYLQLGKVLQVLTLNITARSVGLVIRLFTIVFGLLMQVLLLLIFASYFLIWLTFPVLAAFGLQRLVIGLFI